MTDDWRLRTELGDAGEAARLAQLLNDDELEHDLESSYSQRVVVSFDDDTVFCYAGSREQAHAAEAVIERLASEHGWSARSTLTRWHPTAERWESPDVPLPDGDVAALHERDARIADERAESASQGYPEYEVRIGCSDRREAHELAERLDNEGIPNVHRWRYVLVGANDEASAQALADRLRSEAPAGAELTVELNARAIYDEMPRSPFSIFGGLSG